MIALRSPAFEGLGLEINCCVGLAIALGTGFLYAYLHGKAEPLTASVSAKGGLAAGAIAYGINGVVSMIIVILVGPQMMAANLAASGLSEPVDMQMLNSFLLVITLAMTCAGVVFHAMLCAVGGALGARLLGTQQAGPDTAGAAWR